MSRLTRKTNGKDYCLYCDCIEKENEIFERSQKLLSPEEYYKEEPYKMEDSYYSEDAMNRLGKLEDLMDEYNINSIEELEILINSHKKQEEKIIDLSADLGMFQNENINLTKDIEKYWNIEEELGCSLEVVFKALKDGIIDFENNEHRYIHLRNNGKYVVPSNCWIFHTFHFSYVFKLSDYQKTWWLKGEK